MKKTMAVAALAVSLMSPAVAQERTGDAALGALSGAVVLGPVGAVAGALVGYTAGPSIARSWGWRRGHARRARGTAGYNAHASARDGDIQTVNQVSTPRTTPVAVPPPRRAGPAAPPVQGLE